MDGDMLVETTTNIRSTRVMARMPASLRGPSAGSNPAYYRQTNFVLWRLA